VAEPQRDDAGVDAGVQEVHRCRVAQHVRRDLLGGECRAAAAGGRGVPRDEQGDGVAAERPSAAGWEQRLVGGAGALLGPAAQSAIASPASTGSGSRSWRLPLPVTTNSPARQSRASSRRAATSPMRSPSRDSSIRIAKSRRPIAVCRSQLSSSRATNDASTALTSDASRHLATVGPRLPGHGRSAPPRTGSAAATATRWPLPASRRH
jgi:hypothetical protein